MRGDLRIYGVKQFLKGQKSHAVKLQAGTNKMQQLICKNVKLVFLCIACVIYMIYPKLVF